ncbi:PCYCGC motif-containing (lipo)protein [Peribacillus sp. SCS-26]|uniref:PCYCGC motif-containing (lipo)protein n=1 Tax=Paraperibacillus marinus TaxID=3115295 RepID=UPI003906239A
MNIKNTAIAVFSTAFLLSGCGTEENTQKESSHKHKAEEIHAEHTAGDLRVETKKDTKPAFLAEKPEDMQMLYLAVSQNQKLLEQMPCYCGCGEEAGHKSNYDCFIYEKKDNGNIVWDDHATRCGVCMEIAAQSIIDLQDGKTIEEIRKQVDAKYQKGFAKPTPTPPVEAL